MKQGEIIKRLREPFTSQEIEWKLQVTAQDKARGMAVPYLDARAVQKRLDEVVGPFGWKNEYIPWQDKAQICGISIYNDERGEWVTKFDGAENSDIEPVKGGLSDSFKRAACLWGIGRYMYEMEGVWVDVEPKGKSSAIKQNQYGRLENEYNQAVSRIFGAATQNGSSAAQKMDINTEQPTVTADFEYKVHSVKPSGKSSQLLELVDGNGEVVTAYVKASDKSITAGSCLNKVQMEKKQSSYGPYNLINAYQVAA